MQLTDDQNSRVEALLCESDSVRHFVSHCVEKRDSSDVTVNEMVTAYINFCETRGWQAVTVRQFESTVSDIMMEIHRASKRTDIQRNNKNQRGYANIALKDQSK